MAIWTGVTADGQVFVQASTGDPALLTDEDALTLSEHLTEVVRIARRVRNTPSPQARP
ncbi:hypothetical protein M8C13_04635 [Crossiella sp. SN42]|uniref:hypothetical protein n=1 Tax=Crossiella sp. SN42 TaxID=2944808 RepID=UPI00207C263F|nr:hypothetical protein [Crossiella sp. SN42]MCO1575046.1 hypothetical protein [Crossiella sp. SN42]